MHKKPNTRNRHLVDTLKHRPMTEVRGELREAHDYLANCCLKTLRSSPPLSSSWGIEMKRQLVELPTENRPTAISKEGERLGEVINMVATLERLIDALEWFENHQEFKKLKVRECHPSTSHTAGSNDLVLEDANGDIVVRCEVCDVASTRAAQNGKERSDLKNLGCEESIPTDSAHVHRFICTSSEFANALSRMERRVWKLRSFVYTAIPLTENSTTVLLELTPKVSMQ